MPRLSVRTDGLIFEPYAKYHTVDADKVPMAERIS
jgi:hypothetical protein